MPCSNKPTFAKSTVKRMKVASYDDALYTANNGTANIARFEKLTRWGIFIISTRNVFYRIHMIFPCEFFLLSCCCMFCQWNQNIGHQKLIKWWSPQAAYYGRKLWWLNSGVSEWCNLWDVSWSWSCMPAKLSCLEGMTGRWYVGQNEGFN